MENNLINNRGIIHRAYDQVSKEIKTDFFIDSNGGVGIIDHFDRYEPKPLWIILRPTYWTDKTGVSLFEGDIVSYKESEAYNYVKENEDEEDKITYAFIEWNEAHSKLSLNRNSNYHINLEMITYEGNIFENKELVDQCFE